MQIRHPVRFVVWAVIAVLVSSAAGFTGGWLLQTTSWLGAGEDVSRATRRSLDNVEVVQRGVSDARGAVESSLDRIRADRDAALELIAQYSGDSGSVEPGSVHMEDGNTGDSSSRGISVRLPALPGGIWAYSAITAVVLFAATMLGLWIGRSTKVVRRAKAQKTARIVGSDGATVNPRQAFPRVHID